jgi:hypothetical protein
VASHTVKPGSKFFDVLGRVYDKMKARIQYYVSKDAIKKDERDIALEFEVWARIIRDSEGNDIQVFIKEDKKRGLRKDSSFYHSGYWEVFEFDDAARETRFRASSGISSLSRYDDKERLKEYYRTDKGDTLESQRYEWKNGRLVRMTANGVVRNYIYGKTLSDTVRVVPSDEGFNYHRGYNGTAGKIPEEGTPDYETFSLNPYGHVAFGEKEEDEELPYDNFAAKRSEQLNILAKVTANGCVKEKDGMPEAQCIRFERKDMSNNYEAVKLGMGLGYPGYYGRAEFYLSLKFNGCQCNELGKYQRSFSGKTVKEKIEVLLSNWKYEFRSDPYSIEYWHERNWSDGVLQETYNHEATHITNARRMAITINTWATKDFFSTKNECEKNIQEDRKKMKAKWNEWYIKEQDHDNPNSPE